MVIPQLFGLITKTPFYQRGVQYNKERPTAVFDEFNKLFVEKNGAQTISDIKKYNELKTEQIAQIQNIVSRELNVDAGIIHISTK